MTIDKHRCGKRFMLVRSKGITYVICYIITNESILEFQEKLDLVEDAIREEEGIVLLSGAFNARAVKWRIPKHYLTGNRKMKMSA